LLCHPDLTRCRGGDVTGTREVIALSSLMIHQNVEEQRRFLFFFHAQSKRRGACFGIVTSVVVFFSLWYIYSFHIFFVLLTLPHHTAAVAIAAAAGAFRQDTTEVRGRIRSSILRGLRNAVEQGRELGFLGLNADVVEEARGQEIDVSGFKEGGKGKREGL
jgi:hypothetical protein